MSGSMSGEDDQPCTPERKEELKAEFIQMMNRYIPPMCHFLEKLPFQIAVSVCVQLTRSFRNKGDIHNCNYCFRVDKLFGLCTSGCDYSGVVVKCAGEARRRRKRQAGGTPVDIDFNIPVDK